MNLEQEILEKLKTSISESVEKTLSGYSSPLTKLIEQVIQKHQNHVFGLIEDSLLGCLTLENSKKDIQDAISHKIARVLISKTEGEIEKVANELKQNPEFRAKLTLLISGLVKEFSQKNS